MNKNLRTLQPVAPPTTNANGTSLRMLVIYCGLLMAITGFSVDIMLPGFAQISADLAAPMPKVQQSVAIFALCFGFGQILYGSASDRFGRRPAIAFGMSVFIAGAIISLLATDIEILLMGRALQGFGAGAGPVVARAILRDTHSGINLARAMAVSMAVFSIGPIIAPMLGYFILEAFDWRIIFLCIGLFALSLLLFDWLVLKETNNKLNPKALDLAVLSSSIITIIRHPQSRYFVFCATLAYCALFSYVSNAPLIYATAFDIDGFQFAALFAFTGLGIIIGQILNRTLLPRVGVLAMLKLSSLILLIASASVAALSMQGILDAYNFTALMFLFNTSFLVVVSNTAALTLDPHPNLAGMASAFFGAVTNGLGALFIAGSFDFIKGDVQTWSWVMTVMTASCVIALWLVHSKKFNIHE